MENGAANEESAMANLCMCVIGIGYLFPISAIWAAFDYWKMLFPTRNIEFTVTLVYQSFSLATVAVLSLGKSVSLGPRITGGFCGQFIALFFILAFRWITDILDNAHLYALVFVLVALCAIATGYLDSALLSLCSQYSPRMQGFLQLGIGFGTLVSVLYRDLTKLLLNDDMVDSVTMYFSIALATVVVCLSCYKVLMGLPVSRSIAITDGAQSLLTPPQSPHMSLGASFTPISSPMFRPSPSRSRTGSGTPNVVSPFISALPASAIEEAEKGNEDTSFSGVLGIVWRNQLTIFLNFVLTTLCYPGLLTSIPCRDFLELRENAWFQTLLLTVFTLSDTAARFFTERRGYLTYKNIYVTVIGRAMLFPVLLFCAKSASSSDMISFFAVACFGAGNGYCVSLSLITVNEIPGLTNDQRKTCGRISACAVNGGLAVGSFLAAALAACIGLSSTAPA